MNVGPPTGKDAVLAIDPARVALLSESTGLGGGERVVSHLIEYWRTLGVEVHLIIPDRAEDGWLTRFARDAGARVHTVHFSTRRLFGTVLSVARIFSKERIEVAHAHMFGMTVVASLAGRLAGIPVISTLHNGDEQWSLVKRRIPMAIALRLCAHRCVVSNLMRADVASAAWMHEGQFRTVYNGARDSDQSRSNARRSLGLGDDTPLFVALGSRTRNKDHATAIRAFLDLDTRDDARLIVAGRPDDGDGDILELPVEQSAKVQVFDHRDDVDSLLAAADGLIVCSRREGLPMVVVEAMLAGTAIVTTPVGAIPEILSDEESALFFQPGDAATLRAHILRLLESPSLRDRLAANGRSIAKSRLTAHRMGDEYRALMRPPGRAGQAASASVIIPS